MGERGMYSALAPGKPESPPPLKPLPKASFISRVRARPIRTGLIVAAVVACILALILGLVFGLRARNASSNPSSSDGFATLAASPPKSSFPPIQEAFVSFAFELYYFPDYAGTPSSPGTFSDNLLNNIGNISGTKPYIRVGGNSQDLAIYDSTLQNATQATFLKAPNGSRDFGTIKIGSSFFESYKMWPGVKFIHGLNFKNSTTAVGWQSLMDTIPVACKAIGSNLLWWEYGNEPDFYPRPKSSWNPNTYVSQWSNGTAAIKSRLSSSCPNMTSPSTFGFVGPSLAEPSTLPPADIFQAGYNKNGSVKLYTLHNYMGDCSLQPCSLQSILMNHTAVVANLAAVTSQIAPLTNDDNGTLLNPTNTSSSPLPFVLDETNSLLSLTSHAPPRTGNAFGAALWTVDYMLQAASVGISRMHMQQGTDFGYASWQPATAQGGAATWPPYYGNIAVASMVGNIPRDGPPRIVEVQIPGQDVDVESVYACYVNGSTLARVAVVNFRWYNETGMGAGSGSQQQERGSTSYGFRMEGGNVKEGTVVRVQRLTAPGSDALGNVTWDGWSYDFGLDEGRPVRVGEAEETVTVQDGQMSVVVEDSSAVVLNFV